MSKNHLNSLKRHKEYQEEMDAQHQENIDNDANQRVYSTHE